MENGLYVAKVEGETVRALHADEDTLADAATARMFAEKKASREAKETEQKEPPKAQKKKAVTKDTPVDASWFPVKSSPDLRDRLVKCVQYVGICGTMNLFMFFWDRAGLMAHSVAYPSTIVVAAVGAFLAARALYK